MKRIMLLPVLALSSLTIVAQPKLSLSSEKIDLGVVYNGTVKSTEIKLMNFGKDTLRIFSVQPTCGCTTAKQPKSALGPGESDVAKVEFNSTGYRGPVTKYVNISTNDPAKPNMTVTLSIDVKEELEPTTKVSNLYLGTIPVGTSATQELTFKNITAKTIKIKGVVSKNPDIKVSFQPESVVTSGELKVSFTVTSKKTEYINEDIFLETDSKNQPRVPIRLSFVGVKPG
jgi:hypothetical protein